MPYRCARLRSPLVRSTAHRGRHDDPDEGARDEHLPAEPHELVVPQPRQRAAQPDEEEQEHPQLEQNHSTGHQPVLSTRPRSPTAATGHASRRGTAWWRPRRR